MCQLYRIRNTYRNRTIYSWQSHAIVNCNIQCSTRDTLSRIRRKYVASASRIADCGRTPSTAYSVRRSRLKCRYRFTAAKSQCRCKIRNDSRIDSHIQCCVCSTLSCIWRKDIRSVSRIAYRGRSPSSCDSVRRSRI
ncbi:hypothetical protein D9M72_577500 [compost metagenome]